MKLSSFATSRETPATSAINCAFVSVTPINHTYSQLKRSDMALGGGGGGGRSLRCSGCEIPHYDNYMYDKVTIISLQCGSSSHMQTDWTEFKW